MAIVLDTASSVIGEVDGSEQITLALNIADNSNRLILVGIIWDDNESLSSVTYDGDALAEAIALEAYSERNALLYYRVAPSIGNNNVVVTMTAGAGTPELGVGAISLYGVDQEDPIGATNSGSVDNKTGISTALTTTQANSWVVDVLSGEGLTATSGANQTDFYNDENRQTSCASYDSANGIAEYTMEWSWSEIFDREGVHVVAEIKEAGAAGTIVQDLIGPGIIAFPR